MSITEEQQRTGQSEYNFDPKNPIGGLPLPPIVEEFAANCGTDAPTYIRDRPGMSTFVQQGGVVYHTYSPTRVASTACGTCTSGWTARRWT